MYLPTRLEKTKQKIWQQWQDQMSHDNVLAHRTKKLEKTKQKYGKSGSTRQQQTMLYGN